MAASTRSNPPLLWFPGLPAAEVAATVTPQQVGALIGPAAEALCRDAQRYGWDGTEKLLGLAEVAALDALGDWCRDETAHRVGVLRSHGVTWGEIAKALNYGSQEAVARRFDAAQRGRMRAADARHRKVAARVPQLRGLIDRPLALPSPRRGT